MPDKQTSDVRPSVASGLLLIVCMKALPAGAKISEDSFPALEESHGWNKLAD